MKRKYSFWDWMIIVGLVTLLAWSIVGCNLPKRCAVTQDGIAFGGPDAPIQTSHHRFPSSPGIRQPVCEHFFIRQSFPFDSEMEVQKEEYGLCICIHCKEINICK